MCERVMLAMRYESMKLLMSQPFDFVHSILISNMKCHLSFSAATDHFILNPLIIPPPKSKQYLKNLTRWGSQVTAANSGKESHSHPNIYTFYFLLVTSYRIQNPADWIAVVWLFVRRFF